MKMNLPAPHSRLVSILTFCFCVFASQLASAQHFHKFNNIFPLEGIPGYPAEEMVENCGGEYEDARAYLWTWQNNGRTVVWIAVDDAPPNTLFTIWLKMAQSSPLTGAGVTALANPDEIPQLAAMTPDSSLTDVSHNLGLVGDDGTGQPNAANSFQTNGQGRAVYFAVLDFPLSKGAYQFQQFDSSLAPIAVGPVPFTLRLASHCTDNMAHGLVPGVHEMFFDWSFE